MNRIIKKNNKLIIFTFFVILGFALRIWVSQFGSNFDFAMWQFNLELFKEDKSIYEFGNYSYGTPWIRTLYFLDSISFLPLENNSFVHTS